MREEAKAGKVVVEVETKGIEEAEQKIAALADACEVLPAQVSIKNCRDCTINIYPDQNIGVKNVPEQPQSLLPEILTAIFEKVNFYTAAGTPAVAYEDLIDALEVIKNDERHYQSNGSRY